MGVDEDGKDNKFDLLYKYPPIWVSHEGASSLHVSWTALDFKYLIQLSTKGEVFLNRQYS